MQLTDKLCSLVLLGGTLYMMMSRVTFLDWFFRGWWGPN